MPRRYVDTSIWNDDRFAAASPGAKLVYFRLVTGDETGAGGATRVHARRIAADIGLSQRKAEAGLDELVGVDLVRRYDGGWMWLPAWIRYQLTGPGFCQAVRRQARECPDALAKAIGRVLDERAPRKASDAEPTRKRARSRRNGVEPPDRPSSNNGGTNVQPREVAVAVAGSMPPTGANGTVCDCDAEAAATALGAGPPASQRSGEDDRPGQPLSDDLVAAMAPTNVVMAALAERRRLAQLADAQRDEPEPGEAAEP